MAKDKGTSTSLFAVITTYGNFSIDFCCTFADSSTTHCPCARLIGNIHRDSDP